MDTAVFPDRDSTLFAHKYKISKIIYKKQKRRRKATGSLSMLLSNRLMLFVCATYCNKENDTRSSSSLWNNYFHKYMKNNNKKLKRGQKEQRQFHKLLWLKGTMHELCVTCIWVRRKRGLEVFRLPFFMTCCIKFWQQMSVLFL